MVKHLFVKKEDKALAEKAKAEKCRPVKVHDTGVDDELLDNLAAAFEYLYDPENMDHLPLEKKLARYAHRDLVRVKYYKSALKYFGKQRSVMEMLGATVCRKRVIVAPPMAYTFEGRDDDCFESDCDPFNVPMTVRPPGFTGNPEPTLSKAELEKIAHDAKQTEDLEEFHDKYHQRLKIRDDLSIVGNVERWLNGKPDKSELERRADKVYREARRIPHPMKIEKLKPLRGKLGSMKPSIKRPTPLALNFIHEELEKRHLRLVDLFSATDKDKSWTLTRDEMKNAFSKGGIEFPDDVFEDLIVTLDQDNTNQLYYKELVAGLHDLRVELRSQNKLSDGSLTSASQSFRDSSSRFTNSRGLQQKSNSLDVPDSDSRSDAVLQRSHSDVNDIKKRTGFPRSRKPSPAAPLLPIAPKKTSTQPKTQAPPTTGIKAIDDHMTPSVLQGDLAGKVDQYRQERLKEYYDIVQLCKERNQKLDKRLLQKVLLFPADKPAKKIKKHIRFPGAKSCFNKDKFYPPDSKLPPPEEADPALIAAFRASIQNNPGKAATQHVKRPVGGFAAGALLLTFGGGGVSEGFRLSGGTEGDRGGSSMGRQSGMSSRGDSQLSEGDEGGRGGVRRGAGVNLNQVGRYLPKLEDIRGAADDNDDNRVHLSTGWATVTRKVDCWLSFEEFNTITGSLESKYDHSSIRPVSPNAFWPGQLLDKFRIYMDSAPGAYASRRGDTKAIFRPIQPIRPPRTTLGPVVY